jgi:hypothetical protein
MQVVSPRSWAREEFGQVKLGEKLRTERAVQMSTGMIRQLSVSLSMQMGTKKDLCRIRPKWTILPIRIGVGASRRSVGQPPERSQWVHLRDRYSDIYPFLRACQLQGCQFLVRAAQDRRVLGEDEEQTHLFTLVRALPSQGECTLALPARPGHPARTAHVQISFGRLTLLPPAANQSRLPSRRGSCGCGRLILRLR